MQSNSEDDERISSSPYNANMMLTWNNPLMHELVNNKRAF